MVKTTSRTYTDRMKTLIRRESHLKSVLDDYTGKDPSWTRAEYAAIKWAIDVINENKISAMALIERTK